VTKIGGRRFGYLATAISALGGLPFGYDVGVISGAIRFIKKESRLAISDAGSRKKVASAVGRVHV
jgi:hypothetical protein